MRWPSLSRRNLIKGVGLATAAGAAIGVLPGCTNTPQDDVPEPMVVDVERVTNILEEYEEVDLSMSERDTWEAPLGSVLHESAGTWVAVTQAGSSAMPMVKMTRPPISVVKSAMP